MSPLVNKPFQQPKRSSPLPATTTSSAQQISTSASTSPSHNERRRSSGTRASDLLQLLVSQRRSSIESNASTSSKHNKMGNGLDELMFRNAVDLQLPEDAMRDLSVEEREHIQRVMATASRAHTATPNEQESRR